GRPAVAGRDKSGCRPQLVAHRQGREPADKGRLDAAGRSGHLDHIEPSEQLLEERLDLHLRQMLAETDMRAIAEGDVAVVLARDVELEGIGPDVFVAVAGDVEELHRLALFDSAATQAVV